MFWGIKMKKINICLIILFFVFLTGCERMDIKYSPFHQKNSQWMSEDSDFFVCSDEKGLYGYIEIMDEKIPVNIMYNDINGRLSFFGYTKNGNRSDICYEMGRANYKKNSFEVVITSTTFFKGKDKIIFHKLKDDEKIDYEDPYLSDAAEKGQYVTMIDKNADIFCSVIKKYDLRDVEYSSYMAAISFISSGVKELSCAEIYYESDDMLVIEVTDAENSIYYASFYRGSGEIDSIYEGAPNGELIYSSKQ